MANKQEKGRGLIDVIAHFLIVQLWITGRWKLKSWNGDHVEVHAKKALATPFYLLHQTR